uniref:Uncharacterized protein n=1 Tax=Arundo donax TaxID=35708 RepID=A0A0A9GZP9_ARUDO
MGHLNISLSNSEQHQTWRVCWEEVD